MYLEREHMEFLESLLDTALQAFESQGLTQEAAITKYLHEEVMWALEGDEEEATLH